MLKLAPDTPFYSIQAQGISTGMPAVFIRTTGCNFQCGLDRSSPGTWVCDSEKLWKKGTDYTNEQLEQKIIDLGELPSVLLGKTHLVWTGGEPTLPPNSAGIQEFLRYIDLNHQNNMIFNELETNGSLFCEDLIQKIQQINCSPKLSNSGISKDRRINTESIKQIMNHKNFWFKFVISTEDDVQEMIRDYILPFNMPADRIILMPGVDRQSEIIERTQFAIEMSKKYHYRMCTRVQILCYDKEIAR